MGIRSSMWQRGERNLNLFLLTQNKGRTAWPRRAISASVAKVHLIVGGMASNLTISIWPYTWLSSRNRRGKTTSIALEHLRQNRIWRNYGLGRFRTRR